MPKRLKSYRLDPGECADFASAVRITGETETAVLRTAIRAYIQRVLYADVADAPLSREPVVYTVPEEPASHEEPPANACKHPAEYVDGTWCRACSSDVW